MVFRVTAAAFDVPAHHAERFGPCGSGDEGGGGYHENGGRLHSWLRGRGGAISLYHQSSWNAPRLDGAVLTSLTLMKRVSGDTVLTLVRTVIETLHVIESGDTQKLKRTTPILPRPKLAVGD